MHIAVAILVFQCSLSLTIKVPVTWDNDSEVKPVNQDKPNEYFHYTANKPQFAVEVAQFHNVKSPEKHYESYPINPHTDVNKPHFGNHQMLNSANKKYKPYQEYIKQDSVQIKPIANYYEVYHPYEAEVPALQSIYKDPVLNKIRNDVVDSKNRLQKYEHDAGEPDIHKEEYLESPDSIDKKKIPHQNIPAQYEIHRPLRRPVYYQRVPINNNREHFLNQKLRHPWNQNYVKVTPMHYRPLKHNLHQLRQQHALTYDDSKNEYPQLIPPQHYAEKPEGYDIFEKGRENFKNIRNSFDESLNKAVLKNRPVQTENLELQNEDHSSDTEDSEDDFIPIKNYAQVRKTATYRHVPQSDAYADAKDLEEIQNAPRLREAIKSSKNQVVYSEEGYEDSAYDHAGEQKHASDHEGHGGFLKENEESKGKYKIPTIDTAFIDKGQTDSRDQVLHGEKWNDEHKENLADNYSEDYSDTENDYSEKSDIYDPNEEDISERNKRESNSTNYDDDHDVSKREANLTSSKDEKNRNTLSSTQKSTMKKYPYYFNVSKSIDQNSPLRYSENLNLMPNKTKDESAFYNSRGLMCPEVEKEVNPVPEKFNNDEVSEDSNDEDQNDGTKGDEEFKNFKKKQRLQGLGDKIDCLKMKYFGEEPLDSPFFNEDLIKNPQPLIDIQSKMFNMNVLGKSVIHEQDIKEKLIPSETQKTESNHSLQNNIFLIPTSPTLNINNSTTKSDNISGFHLNNEKNLHNNDNITNRSIRKKRAVTFMYEPYKVIKESQVADTKKLSTSSNISPLIRKLQTRQIVDHNLSNNTKYHKNIGKNDRPLTEQDFIDVSMDQRRGEPRYEIDLKNHRPKYSPVENRTSMSVEDYRAKTASEDNETKKHTKSFKYIPRTVTTQSIASSNIISKMIHSTTTKPQNFEDENEDDDDDYEEYDDESEEETDENETTSTTTSTTTTPKVIKRIHISPTAKTHKPEKNSSMNLQLTTRFHTSTTDASPINVKPPEHTEELIMTPNYREKKKKTTKSTLVTDTESYGDDTDDMRREEIDAMIGIKQDMDEYTPTYEKEIEQSNKRKNHAQEIDEEEQDDSSQEEDDDDEDSSEEDDYEDEEEDDSHHIPKTQENSNRNTKDVVHETIRPTKIEVTTSEPTKRTLMKTTEPTAITETLSEVQPTVIRKKVEIHKELPVNETSPHVTRFEQDIKEIEVIKQLDRPHSKNNKHSSSLNIYKDENLAKEINNLGDVDIFNDNIDLDRGPRHGGNYRSIDHNPRSDSDVETSQSKTNKRIQLKTTTVRPKNVNNRNAGLNRTTSKTSGRARNIRQRQKANTINDEKSAKFIELQDDNNGDNDENINVYNGNSKNYNGRNNNRPMHGGNYRSAKLTLNKNRQDVTTEISTTKRNTQKRNRKVEAEVLNAYAKAVTAATTTPAFILDPSKRMYYYLEE